MNLVGAASADRGLQFSNTSAKCVSVNSKIVPTAQGTWKSLFGGDRCSPVLSSSSHSSSVLCLAVDARATEAFVRLRVGDAERVRFLALEKSILGGHAASGEKSGWSTGRSARWRAEGERL